MKEAMKLALEALEDANNFIIEVEGEDAYRHAITALEEALAKQEQDVPEVGFGNIKQEQGEPVAHLWQHGETGRTRVVMPDQIITADANWFVVGPLFLGAAPQGSNK